MAVDPKPRPNQAIYDDILRKMTPQQRLLKAFELTEFARSLHKQGLRHAQPDLSEEELQRLYLDHLKQCHNKNY
jgi:hypothetical protein